MARTLNKVQLIGRLGADPEQRTTSTGVAVTTFSLATNRQWQGKDGTLQEETDWHTIVAWDRLAQICSEHLAKGRLVYIEGRLRNRSWESNGQKNYKTEVVATDMLILDSKGSAPEAAAALPAETSPRAASNGKAAAPVAAGRERKPQAVLEEIEDPDDLPF
jgi:single-strand DNA-binding protein